MCIGALIDGMITHNWEAVWDSTLHTGVIVLGCWACVGYGRKTYVVQLNRKDS